MPQVPFATKITFMQQKTTSEWNWCSLIEIHWLQECYLYC